MTDDERVLALKITHHPAWQASPGTGGMTDPLTCDHKFYAQSPVREKCYQCRTVRRRETCSCFGEQLRVLPDETCEQCGKDIGRQFRLRDQSEHPAGCEGVVVFNTSLSDSRGMHCTTCGWVSRD